jgi:hypothetical protein
LKLKKSIFFKNSFETYFSFVMEDTDLLTIVKDLRSGNNICSLAEFSEQHSFIKLGKVWQALLLEGVRKSGS